MMMVMDVAGARRLQVLLQSVEIFLRGGKISRLQILGKLIERLRDGITVLRAGAALRSRLLQGCEVGLRGRQIPRLQGLAQLLELLLKLLPGTV